MDKIAIGVLSFRRPDYLRVCLKSLAANTEKHRAEIFLFQDGAVNKFSGVRYAPDADIERSLEVFDQANLPNKTVIRQEHNIGPAGGVSTMLLGMFGRGHDYAVLIANDMEVNKFFIKTHRVIYEQFKNVPRVGVLRTGPVEPPSYGGPVYSYEQAKKLENKVCYGFYEMQDFGIWRKCWEKIKPDIEFFHDHVTSCDWRRVVDYTWQGKDDTENPHFKAIVGKFGTFPEDVINVRAAQKAGFQGLQTLVPRIKGFGEYSALRKDYQALWASYRVDEIKLWNVGDVNAYEVVPYSRLAKPPAPPGPAPSEIMMVYAGNISSPFSLHGDKSRHWYYRIKRGEPLLVKIADVPFFEKNGFKRA